MDIEHQHMNECKSNLDGAKRGQLSATEYLVPKYFYHDSWGRGMSSIYISIN